MQLVILHDITEQWATRARLDRAAREDPLTGLINRGELLRQVSELTDESGGPHVAVIFLDLDGFKMVNDTRGHQVGDELLIAVARRIRAAVRPEDSLARIGGDEFVVLCPRLAEPQDVRAIAERIRATLDQPVTVEGRSHRISMSVGIALARADAIDPADLLRQADMAMYRAKDAGRNTVRVHSAEMDEELEVAQRIREALGVALEVEEPADDGEPAGLLLQYQPIVEISTGHLAYVEALARLRLSGGGVVYPSQFLPVAARAGLNGALSEQVLRRALRQRAVWRSEGVDVPVGLNLARGQVYSASFAVDALRIIAEQSDVPAAGGLRDGGVRPAGAHRTRAADPAQAADVRDRAGHRPLRDRLLLPGCPAVPRTAPGQDRSLLRVEHHRQQRAIARSSRPLCPPRTHWARRSWPRGSRPASSSTRCASSGATRHRATSSRRSWSRRP